MGVLGRSTAVEYGTPAGALAWPDGEETGLGWGSFLSPPHQARRIPKNEKGKRKNHFRTPSRQFSRLDGKKSF